MFFCLKLIASIESIYEPKYEYSLDKGGPVQYRDDFEKFFENELKEGEQAGDKQEDNNFNDLKEFNEFDSYKNELSKNNLGKQRSHIEFKLPTQKPNYNIPSTLPQQQSISRSILYTPKNSLPMILSKEFNDISQELNTKLTNSIYNTRRENIDHDKYRELIVIKKRVLSDGKHKVVDMDVSGRIVPRIAKDGGLRMFLACLIFLLACVLFTASMKFYKSYLTIKKINPMTG